MPEKVPFWLDTKKRAILFQFLTLAIIGLLAYYLVSNTLHNLEKQRIATGFGFLHKEASFEIGESLIPYSAAHSYARALLVGALNTGVSNGARTGKANLFRSDQPFERK